MNLKVFVTSRIPEPGVNLLSNKFEVRMHSRLKPPTRKEIIKSARNCHAILTLLSDKIDKEVIDSMNQCRIIANYAVGYNNIDIEYAHKKGIVVTNTPDVLTDSTADLALTLTLACARRIVEGEEMMRKNKFTGWNPTLLLGVELKDKLFGILGAGRIGTAAAIRASAFGCRILYCSNNRNPLLEQETSAKRVSLDQLLKKSDILSIHVPLNSNTNGLLSKKKLELLKSSAILINTARGEIIDEKHLIRMLEEKRIFSAGFDVYQNEPVFNQKLIKLKNAVLLPHIGSATKEARNSMSLLAAKNIDRVLSGKNPLTPV